MAKKKSDFDNVLDVLEAAAGIAAIAAVSLKKTHDLLSQFDWDDEEAIAPEPAPKKQLPSARRRRKNG